MLSSKLIVWNCGFSAQLVCGFLLQKQWSKFWELTTLNARNQQIFYGIEQIKGIVVNRTCPSILNRVSLEYTSTVLSTWAKRVLRSHILFVRSTTVRGVFRICPGGWLQLFIFPRCGGGTQHLFGPENPLKSIDFTGPGGGLSPP